MFCLVLFVLCFCTCKEEGNSQGLIGSGTSNISFSFPQKGLDRPVVSRFPLLTVSDDFDGDHLPDFVYTSGNGRQSDLYLQLSSRSRIDWLGSGGDKLWLQLEGLDINNDHFLDLVLTGVSTTIPAAIFLGDGRGNFIPVDPWNFVRVYHHPRHNLTLPANSRIEAAAILSAYQEQFDHLFIEHQSPIRKANLLLPCSGWVRCLRCLSPQYSPRSPPVSPQVATL